MLFKISTITTPSLKPKDTLREKIKRWIIMYQENNMRKRSGITVLQRPFQSKNSQVQQYTLLTLGNCKSKPQWASTWPIRTQFSSVTQSCPTLCDPMNRSMPGLPVHHKLPEFTQTHAHWVSDATQPSHPLSSPPPPAPNPSQHRGYFQWVNSWHEVAKLLEFQLQHQSFQWTPRTDLQDGLVGSPCSPRESPESFLTPQFKSINSTALSFLYRPTLTSIHNQMP